MRRGEYRAIYGIGKEGRQSKSASDGRWAILAEDNRDGQSNDNIERHVEAHKVSEEVATRRHNQERGSNSVHLAERTSSMRACRELAAHLRDILQEGPAGVPGHSQLTSILVELVVSMADSKYAEGNSLQAISKEAKQALSRLRTVNASFLSNLDYVCALLENLETSLDQCNVAVCMQRHGSISSVNVERTNKRPLHSSNDEKLAELSSNMCDKKLFVSSAPSEELEHNVQLVSEQHF